jgi:transcriptional regulator with XRE-family HTH domain
MPFKYNKKIQFFKKGVKMITVMPRKSTLELPPIELGNMSVGQRIAKCRKDIGMTQSQLADTMGLKQNLVSDYERGKIRPHPEMLARFAIALQVSSDKLLGLEESDLDTFSNRAKNLMKKLRQAIELPVKDQRVLINVLEGLVVKNQKG